MRCPSVDELPPPPPGRTGWPWTEESERVADRMPGGRPWPRISITTPSYNQGAFLEETIRSVLLQGYPRVEYIVMDGGSTDESLAVIERYAPWLARWESGPDRGQSHAVNKGWALSTGELVAYLCSDDVLLPGALATVARAWNWSPSVAMVTGGVVATDEHSRFGARRAPTLPAAAPLDISLLDHERVLLPQPSSFFSRTHLDQVGRWLRESLAYTMDRELMYRVCRSGQVVLLDETLATYREHAASKTVSAVLRQHAEAPRALACCTWGGPEAAAQRRLVGRWRVAKGHYLYAQHCASRTEALRHLIQAWVLRPSYVPRRGSLRVLLHSAGMLTPLRGARRAWRRIGQHGA